VIATKQTPSPIQAEPCARDKQSAEAQALHFPELRNREGSQWFSTMKFWLRSQLFRQTPLNHTGEKARLSEAILLGVLVQWKKDVASGFVDEWRTSGETTLD